MKYYLITYSAKVRFNGMRDFFCKAIDTDPVDYFINIKNEFEKEKAGSYSDAVINFFTEITKEQYLKLI